MYYYIYYIILLCEYISLWKDMYDFTQPCKRKSDCTDLKEIEISEHKGCFTFCLWTGNYCVGCLSSYISAPVQLVCNYYTATQTEKPHGPEPEIALLCFTNIICKNTYSLGNRCQVHLLICRTRIKNTFKHSMSIKWQEHRASGIYNILIIYVSINIYYLDLHVFFNAENLLGFFLFTW